MSLKFFSTLYTHIIILKYSTHNILNVPTMNSRGRTHALPPAISNI